MNIGLEIHSPTYLTAAHTPIGRLNDGCILHIPSVKKTTEFVRDSDIRHIEGNSIIRVIARPTNNDDTTWISHILDIPSLKILTIPDNLHAFYIEASSNTLMYFSRDRLISLRGCNLFAEALVDTYIFPLSRLKDVYFVFEYKEPAEKIVDLPEFKVVYKPAEDFKVWNHYVYTVQDDESRENLCNILKTNNCLMPDGSIVSLPPVGFRGEYRFKKIDIFRINSAPINTYSIGPALHMYEYTSIQNEGC